MGEGRESLSVVVLSYFDFKDCFSKFRKRKSSMPSYRWFLWVFLLAPLQRWEFPYLSPASPPAPKNSGEQLVHKQSSDSFWWDSCLSHAFLGSLNTVSSSGRTPSFKESFPHASEDCPSKAQKIFSTVYLQVRVYGDREFYFVLFCFLSWWRFV